MEKKNLVKIALIIMAVLIVLIAIEVGIRKVNNFIEERKEISKTKEYEKLYEGTEKYKEETFAENTIKDFMTLITSKNVDKLFENLNEDYKDYKFSNNKEKFVEYINQNWSYEDASFELQDYKKINGKFLCRILLFVNNNYSSFQVLIGQKEEDSYDIMLNDILVLDRLNMKASVDANINAHLLYKVTLSGTCTYLIEYENSSNRELIYTHDFAKLNNTRGYEYLGNTDNLEILLKPGEKIRVEYVFSGENINLYDETKLTINLKDTDNKNIEFSVFLDYNSQLF